MERRGKRISPRQRRLNDFFSSSQKSSKPMNKGNALLDKAGAARPIATVSPMAGPSKAIFISDDDDDDDFEDFSSVPRVKGTQIPCSKQVKKETEEEEEAVQAVRKSTKRVIASDDEVDIEDLIDDSSPLKSKVDEESENGLAIEDEEEDFFQDDFFGNEEEEKGPGWEEMLKPQDSQEFTSTTNAASDTALIETHSKDTSQCPFGKTQAIGIEDGHVSPSVSHCSTQAEGGVSVLSPKSTDPVYKDESFKAEVKTSSALGHTSKFVGAAPKEENETNLSFPKVSEEKRKLQSGILHPLGEEAPVHKVTPMVTYVSLSKAQKPSISFLRASEKAQDTHPVQQSLHVLSASSCTPQSLPAGASHKIPNPAQEPSTTTLQDACKTSLLNMPNFGSSLEVMSEDQILKHPILRVTELEEDDISMINSLQSSLLSIMAKLLMSLPLGILQEVPSYNTTQHMKAMAAYKKIVKCLENYEECHRKRELQDPQSFGDNSLCLSPNEQHYRSTLHSQNSFSMIKNTGIGSCEHQEANATIVPDLNNGIVIDDSMGMAHCKKSLDFSTDAISDRISDPEMHQGSPGNFPSTSRVSQEGSSAAVDNSSKCSSIQTSTPNVTNAQKAVLPRKFSFGSHRKLASGSDKAAPASSDKLSGLRTANTRSLLSLTNTSVTPNISTSLSTSGLKIANTNTRPLFNPSNTSLTPKASALVSASVHASTSGFKKSNVRPVWQKDSDFGSSTVVGKTSTASVYPRPENLVALNSEKIIKQADYSSEFPPDDVMEDDFIEVTQNDACDASAQGGPQTIDNWRLQKKQSPAPSFGERTSLQRVSSVPSNTKIMEDELKDEDFDDFDETVSLGSRAREKSWKEGPFAAPGKVVKTTDKILISEEKNYTKAIYKSPNKEQIPSLNEPGAARFTGNVRNDGVTGEFSGMNYPHCKEMLKIFHQHFGLRQFRENQKEAINAALLGKDCFVLMPTGGGKSLCYQLPACVTEGVTIVISPLKSLMQDQVQKLASLDIHAGRLSGDISLQEENQTFLDLSRKEITMKLLYVTPEKISASQKFTDLLERLYNQQRLSRFVIDEAHCVSDWGHDFRPDYKKLSILRQRFPGVPLMALTATATPRVRVDILHQLGLDADTKWFLNSFNRINLRYQVLPKKGKKVTDEVAKLIKAKYKNQSGIVYCLSRKECDTVAADLTRCGIMAKSYHAGLADIQRSNIQNQWINDKVKVICATIAFGMGIDKPDVRFVMHYSLPKSIEGYYQESGRAGRDGEAADCILFYSYPDMHRIRKLIEMDQENWQAKQNHFDNLWRMVAFCENRTDCRRSQMLNYFGEIFDRENCRRNIQLACDNCKNLSSYVKHNVSQEVRTILQTVKQLCTGGRWSNNFTLNHFVDIMKGSKLKKIMENGHDRLSLHGIGKDFGRNDIERLFRRLVLEGYLQEDMVVSRDDMTFAYLRPGQKCDRFLSNPSATFHVDISHTRTNQVVADSSSRTSDDSEIKEIEKECYKDLLSVVKGIASAKGINYTNVINMTALRCMSLELPESEEEMMKIPHVTRANYEKYGEALLDVTQRYAAQKLVVLSDRAEADMMEDSSSLGLDDSTSWMNSISAPNPGTSPHFGNVSRQGGFRRGIKRKRNFGNWRGRGRGKAKKQGGKSAGSPTKKSRYAACRTKVAAAATSARGESQGVRRPHSAGRGSSSSLLLQRPKPQAQPFQTQSRVVRF
ncbi:recQ-like DNA helicase BLM isoform X1 [Scylla paramamosain]|uniref:recQ-like DNA helicase BLM isoform X1 n=2 Tax=Scylla paramamosain TaxID=85552 RepID=UPI003082A002